MIELALVYGPPGGTTRLELETLLDGFYPQPPAAGAATVTDQAVVVLHAASGAALDAAIAAITTALQYGRQHPDGDSGCWLHYAVAAGMPEWRTRVSDGQVLYTARLGAHWGRGRVKISLATVHEPSWEAATETAVVVSNGHGTSSTGVTVYNHDDTGHDGYVNIAADQVTGDLDANCRIEVTNTAANSMFFLWIGQNWTDPANLSYVLEAESGTGETPIARASCSGGNYVSKTILQDVETNLITWSLSQAALNAFHGEWFKLLLRFADVAANAADIYQCKYRIKIGYGAYWIWSSPWVQPVQLNTPPMVRDLATFRLPPGLEGLTGSAPLNLLLQGMGVGGTRTIAIDCATLLPLDGYRHLYATGYAAGNNERVVDDGIHGVTYKDLGAGKIACYDGIGQPIRLRPNTQQRLYFVVQESNTDTHIDWTMSVRVYYRPRRIVP